MNKERSLLIRFFEKVKVPSADPSACWTWMGATPNGYGTIAESWKGNKPLGLLYAHRCAWKIVHGTLPANLVIRHKCDNKACVRPSHLEIGTQADNARDRALRHRGRPSKSGLPLGVASHGRGYRARVKHNSTERYLGTFATIEEAAEAVRWYRTHLYGIHMEEGLK